MSRKIEHGRGTARKFVRLGAAVGLTSLLGVACGSGDGFAKQNYSSVTAQACGDPLPTETPQRLTTVPNTRGQEYVLTVYVGKIDQNKVRFGLPAIGIEPKSSVVPPIHYPEIVLPDGSRVSGAQFTITGLVQETILAIRQPNGANGNGNFTISSDNFSASPGNGAGAECISMVLPAVS